MICDKAAQIHLYFDGELDDANRQIVAAHLEQCAQCRLLLGEIRSLSGLIGGASRQAMPLPAVSRFYTAWNEARERAVMRITGWLTAAAAVLLTAAILTSSPNKPASTAAKPGMWEVMAVAPPVETHGEANSDLVQVAQWMADDLSPGERRK